MAKIEKTSPTGWDSLEGNPWDQPYGLPFYPGKKVSVSFGRLVPSFWYEHSDDRARIYFAFNNAFADIEVTWEGLYRELAWSFGANEFCIIPPGWETTFDWGRRAELVVLYVESDVFGEREPWVSDLIVENIGRFSRHNQCLPLLVQSLLTLSRQASRPRPEVVEGVAIALSSLILQDYVSSDDRPCVDRAGLPFDTVDRLERYVDSHLGKVIESRHLAKLASLSSDHFARRFKIATGMTPKQFVVRRKIEKARELLQTGTCNVTEVVREVGFHDLSHLNRCFRRFFGCSPKSVLKHALATDSYQKRTDGSIDSDLSDV